MLRDIAPAAPLLLAARPAWSQGAPAPHLKRWDEALPRYRQCLELNKDDTQARQELLFLERQKAATRPR
jgi:hypothetical protein